MSTLTTLIFTSNYSTLLFSLQTIPISRRLSYIFPTTPQMFNYYPQVNEWYNFNYDLTLVYMKNRTVQQLWIFLWSQALTHLEVRHRLGGIFIYTWSPLLFSSPYLTPFLASKPAGATCPKSQQKAALNFSYLPNLTGITGIWGRR